MFDSAPLTRAEAAGLFVSIGSAAMGITLATDPDGTQVLVFGDASQGIQIIYHGDDGTVVRPAIAVVYWIGAATPANAVETDLWYTATVLAP